MDDIKQRVFSRLIPMDDVIWSCPDCDGDLERDSYGLWCPECEQVVLMPEVLVGGDDDD